MRIKHKVNVRIGDDADMKDLLFGPSDELSETIIDGFTKQTNGKLKVLATETEAVPFGDITAVKGIFLKLDGDASIKINGISTAIQLRRSSTGTGVMCKLFLEADITAFTVTAGSADVNGIYCVWGDVAA